MILNLVPGILERPNTPGSISYRHPDYEARWWWREFYRISYLGGREYYRPSRLSVQYQEPNIVTLTAEGQLPMSSTVVQGTKDLPIPSVLFRHNREKSWEFENRRQRSHYLNFIQPIVKSLVSHATKVGTSREGPERVMEFWKGVDYKREEPIGEFVKDGLRWAQVMGIMWACVDQKPDGDKGPYAYWVSPLDIMDWGIGEDGEIEWLKQFVYTERVRSWDQPIVPVYRFRIWDRQNVSTYEVGTTGGAQTVRRRSHGAGVVPFVPLFSQRDKESVFPDGTPIMGDACKLANSVYNYSSLKDEIGYKQTFSWLAIPDKKVDTVQIGLNTAFGYDPQQTTAVPTYVSPDPEQARVLMEFIATGISQLRQMLGIGRGRQEGSMQKSSEGAMELESEDKRSILDDIAAEAQSFETRVAKMVQIVGGKKSTEEADEVVVKYKDDFDLRSFTDEVNEYLIFDKIGLSPEVNLKARQDLVRKKYADLPPEEIEELVESMVAKTVDTSLQQGQAVEPVTDPNANRPRTPGKGNTGPNGGKATGAVDPGEVKDAA